MAGKPGRKALVKVTGVATTLTNEPAANTGDNKTYQITDATKRILDRTAAITVKVSAVATGESYTLNRLTGTVTFATVNAGRGPVTLSGQYLPTSTVAECKGYSYELLGINGDDTVLGDDWITRVQLRKDVKGSLDRLWIDKFFSDALLAETVVVLQFWSDATTLDMTCWAMLTQAQLETNESDFVKAPVSFEGATDAENVAFAA